MIATQRVTPLNNHSPKWLERAFLVSVFLACLLAISHHNADPDFWGHVQYGRDVLREGLPSTTTYSYTAEGRRWVNHENLSELLMAWGVSTIGPSGLLLVKSVLGLLLLGLIYRQAKQDQVATAPAVISMLLVACNLMHSWTLRPQLMTYFLFGLTIALVTWCFYRWPQPWGCLVGRSKPFTFGDDLTAELRQRLKWLWLLPLILVVWTNSHGGFVAGGCIVGVYLVARGVEAWLAFGRRSWPIVGLLAGVLVVTLLATLANPYGIELHRWLLGALGKPRPEITEWRPPEFWSPVWPIWWLMVFVFLTALVATRKPRDWSQTAILCLTLWQACEHRRHIAFFAILFGFWMPIHVQSLFERLPKSQRAESEPRPISPRLRWSLLGALTVVIAVLGFNLFSHHKLITVHRDGYPVSAFQYILDQNLSGNMIVRFKWAQYAIAAFGPPTGERPLMKVAFDGRFRTCYPQEMVDMYFDFALGDAPPDMRYRSSLSPPIDGSRILQYKHPDFVLIDRAQASAVRILQQHADEWTLLYQDSLAQLWGRSDKFGNPTDPAYVPPERRYIAEDPQTGIVAWPALPQRASDQAVHQSSAPDAQPTKSPLTAG